MRITIAETYEYHKKAEKVLFEQEREEIINYLSLYPEAGVLMQGTGGIRKLRWSYGNRGKSGGVRVIYYYHNNSIPLYLLTLFTKSEQINLSQKECNELARLVKLIKQTTRRQMGNDKSV